ncbi:uncharacterized protein CBL_08008 [Carabus blaptoides fortunei]
MVIKFSKPVIIASSIATGIGLAYLLKDQLGGKQYDRNLKIDNKVVIITGANTGIGMETAQDLARRGAKIYMACRDMTKCEKTRQEIVLDTRNKYVYCRYCDLSSLESIRQFAEQFNKEQTRLDILINNAGVMRTPYTKTKDGFEMQLGVNHLGHFLLTNLLLDKLKSSAPSRIINVSSIAHYRGNINTTDLNSEKEYDKASAYSQSKLANILFTKELAERLKASGVTVNAVHPGLVDTEIIRHMSFFNSWFSKIFLKPFMWPFIKSPRQGAQTTIYAALDPGLDRITGKYFSDCHDVPVAPQADDDKTAKWLWAVSEKWTRINKENN